MYAEHHDFEAPSPAARIWRYIDFAKLVSTLSQGALWFSRVDHLGDSFEGAATAVDLELRASGSDRLVAHLPKDRGFETGRQLSDSIGRFRQEIRRFTLVNCWHISEHESAAMWNLYVRSGEGVAIQSTFQRLKDSFKKCEETVRIGVVRYVDYDHDAIDPASVSFLPFLRKRRAFEHEHELRAIMSRAPWVQRENGVWYLDREADSAPVGIYVPVDLELLIQSVVVAPAAADWFREAVAAALQAFGVVPEPARSRLDDTPQF